MSFDVWKQVSRVYPYDHICIGYRTPKINYHPILFSPSCKGHIELFVHDYGVRDKGPGLIIFSKNHAKAILKLVEREKNNVHHIVFQCDAGISRSSATAAAISKILYNDDSFVFDSRWYVPNTHIYQTILKTNFEGEKPLLSAF